MTFKESKIGKVTWVDPAKGAFIEDLSDSTKVTLTKQAFSPTSQVFVPTEITTEAALEAGQLVQYEEEDNVATKVDPLS